jgi:signal transduction histidine kinase
MEPVQRERIKISLAIAWLVFTISLASWWLIFGLRQTATLQRIEGPTSQTTVRLMLTLEGATLLASLLIGGSALLYGIHRERTRHDAVEDFFAAFSHDLRTSLASLRLQVESLQEDFVERDEDSPLLQRLLGDAVRIQLQLDNSLFYANRQKGRLFIERVSLRDTVRSIASDFQDLRVTLEQDAPVLADARALEVILRNLFQNALIHGRANAIDIILRDAGDARISMQIEDNGCGPESDAAELGRLFSRPTRRSGTGVGLYISRRLLQRMNGLLTLSRGLHGLVATLELRKASA